MATGFSPTKAKGVCLKNLSPIINSHQALGERR